MIPDWNGYQKFRASLADANPPGLYPIEWLDDQIIGSKAFPIIGERAAMVVGLRIYPGGARVGYVMAAAGDKEELIDRLAPQSEEWAHKNGCQLVMLEGREGWKRVLNGRGWKTHQVVLLKEL